MDQERERIQADLRGLLAGDVRCDDVFLQLYASDASIYEIRPLGVIRPKGLDDVVACVQYAADNGLPIHARGAGSGLAGESLGPGLVIDFSYYMRRIVETTDDTVRVQPGVVHAQLNRHLARRGRLFGPDPATSSVTTMGSVLALDGAGSHWLKYGSARSRVVSLQAVLADGTVIDAASHPFPEAPSPTAGQAVAPASGLVPPAADARRAELVARLGHLLEREQATIAAGRPRSEVNRSGYQLWSTLEGGQLHLARLLVGSEGTLALFTEATLRTDPAPAHRGVALLFFDRLEAAARAALEARRLGATACDLMDRRLLTIARESDVRYELLLPRDAEAMLVVEHEGADRREVFDAVQATVDRLRRRRRLAFDSRTAFEDDDIRLFLRLARQVVPRLYRLRGSSRAVPFIEDIAVPAEALPDFLGVLQNTFKNHQVTASVFCHAGHGQLHVRPLLDISQPDDLRRMQELADDLYAQVLAVGGTISGEHGDGLSRTWFVRQQYGELYQVMREVKRIFDPQNILNPGKVVADTPQPLTKNLRPVTVDSGRPDEAPAAGDDDAPPRPIVPLQLQWSADEFMLAARNCNGCGRCRTLSPDMRMCPIFHLTPGEEASPRAKANIVRGVLTGRLDATEMTRDALKAVADLCVNCHQCRLECPASVDIPKLMTEVKGEYVASNGLRHSDWFLTRLETVAAWASLASPVVNWALGNRVLRWLLEKSFGIAQGRKLPRVAARSFLRRAARRRLTRPARRSGRKVLYFVDLYANWFDTQLADAVVQVLEHNGAVVFVHPEQSPAGMPQVTLGALDQARRLARANVSLLAEAVRQGYSIVASEPSAALCLQQEYPHLLDDEDARLVAQHTFEACSYLWKLHQTGELELDLKPINAVLGYHLPCHLRAVDPGSPGERLLQLIPGLVVQRLERGCSGMAGVYGLRRENYRSSLRAGWGLISALRDPRLQAGATECSTCKMQMEQGTTKPTIHPIKVLALAYGLMPELASLLTERGEELLVT